MNCIILKDKLHRPGILMCDIKACKVITWNIRTHHLRILHIKDYTHLVKSNAVSRIP